jgi:hypothetical protein
VKTVRDEKLKVLFLNIPVDFLGLVVLESCQSGDMDAGREGVIAGGAVAVATGECLCGRHFGIEMRLRIVQTPSDN